MGSPTALAAYRQHLKEGGLQETYHQLLSYLLELKAAFPSSYPDRQSLSGLSGCDLFSI